MKPGSRILNVIVSCGLNVMLVTIFVAPSGAFSQGTLTTTSFFSHSLNMTRNLQVYLPEGYNPQDTNRYPVAYWLHGATTDYTSEPELKVILDDLIRGKCISPLIVIKPDGSIGPWGGSFYTNSALYGNFEDYIVYDLVKFIDTTYKTIPTVGKRAIWGGSMGGYGAMKLALKHPDIYCCVASLSGVYSFRHFISWVPILLTENGGAPVSNYLPILDDQFTHIFTYLFYTATGAFSPNLNNQPYKVDFPIDSMGNFIDSTFNKWLSQDPLTIAQNMILGSEPAIYFDCGTQDELFLYPFNTDFAMGLDSLGIKYVFHPFVGTHTGQMQGRLTVALSFIDSVMVRYGNIFAVEPSVDKPYARKSVDSVLFRTTFSNIYGHQFTPRLIYANSDSSVLDSVSLFDDGMHGDLSPGDGVFGAYIPPEDGEEFYSLGVCTVDAITHKYFRTPDICSFTTAGPVKIDSVKYVNGSGYCNVRPYVSNLGSSATITGAKVRIYCDDRWATTKTTGDNPLPDISPGAEAGCNSWNMMRYVDSLAPEPLYFNLRFEIMKDGVKYWTDSRVLTGFNEPANLPLVCELRQNYPNPFNPTTTIRFEVPGSGSQIRPGRGGFVVLKVYDVLGREVRTLVNEKKSPGTYEVQFDGSGLASGVYFYMLKAGAYTSVRRMLLLK